MFSVPVISFGKSLSFIAPRIQNARNERLKNCGVCQFEIIISVKTRVTVCTLLWHLPSGVVSVWS